MSVTTKIVRTFVFAFLGAFLPTLADIVFDLSGTLDFSVAGAALGSLIFAASSAGIRAIVAYLPILPDDDVGLTRNPS